jgi:hypothetical protein
MARGCWPVACCDQHGNEYFGSIKGGEILQHLSIVLASKELCSMDFVQFISVITLKNPASRWSIQFERLDYSSCNAVCVTFA